MIRISTLKHVRSLALAPLVTVLLFANGAYAAEEDPAVSTIKANAKVSAFLKKYEGEEYSQQVESMTLHNGSCGFAGCGWSRLVSVTVTRLVSNSPSTTIHAIVSGTSPSIGPATVKFVELDLKPMSESRWNWDTGN